MKVIVVNPIAKQLRKKSAIRAQIHALFGHLATIIDVESPSEVIDRLTAITKIHKIDEIYLVGGDGTFNLILNWITSQPKPMQPALMSVGGGQFCYMCAWHGFRSTDPIKNLSRIFLKGERTKAQEWRPLAIQILPTGQVRYAALVANGIISDIVEWYESVGKGGFLTVLRIVLFATLSSISETIRRRVNRIRLSRGMIRFLALYNVVLQRNEDDPEYAGIVLSAIPELLANSRPFRGTRKQTQFFAVFYQNGLLRLACAAPFLLWFGWQPFWIRSRIFNQPVKEAMIETCDRRLLVDGDLVRFPEEEDLTCRTLIVTAGEPIHLLRISP